MGLVHVSAVVLAAFAPRALANLQINNWCNVGVSLVQSHAGSCDYGMDGNCGSAPWVIPAGTGNSILNLGYITDGIGTSIKISKDGVSSGVLQFEYTVASGQFGGLYWDLSDLDGSGGGLVGTPFANDNVGISPTGNGANTGTCVQIRCAAGQVCLDSYQTPDDANTRTCPVDTGDMWLDLCMPQNIFGALRTVSPLDKNGTDSTDGTTSEHQSRHMHLRGHQAGGHLVRKHSFRA